MRNIYLAMGVAALVVFGSCSKSIFWRAENRIQGEWRLDDVRRFGIFGGRPSFPFENGRFIFYEGGSAEYYNGFGDYYSGSWDIRNNRLGNDCYYDDDGRMRCESQNVNALSLTFIDFNNQDVRTEFFDEIRFFSRNRFKAYIHRGGTTWIFVFRRN